MSEWNIEVVEPMDNVVTVLRDIEADETPTSGSETTGEPSILATM